MRLYVTEAAPLTGPDDADTYLAAQTWTDGREKVVAKFVEATEGQELRRSRVDFAYIRIHFDGTRANLCDRGSVSSNREQEGSSW
ncbi:hypothetical protein BQ8482_111768 [Mesorhizobium delmotii]|uniref:Uncharacterized protein n=1 Tax=Mesorhizobium delmotii TaxID=1631247 RepID=A0A2P9AFF2_9HYPH|nr:hypothetical protein BQ8482_111768 [Mesorhizobium delmotii]